MSLTTERRGDVSVSLSLRGALPFRPTRKQFLARLDLRVCLNADDDLPTRPSTVLPNLVGIGLTGAVRSARCPEW